jgi:hypothetical protein
MVQNKAVVKSVLSGDTVILRGRPKANGPPAERLLALNNVQAPRLGNKDKEDEVRSRLCFDHHGQPNRKRRKP